MPNKSDGECKAVKANSGSRLIELQGRAPLSLCMFVYTRPVYASRAAWKVTASGFFLVLVLFFGVGCYLTVCIHGQALPGVMGPQQSNS